MSSELCTVRAVCHASDHPCIPLFEEKRESPFYNFVFSSPCCTLDVIMHNQSEQLCLNLTGQLCNALQYLHECKIILKRLDPETVGYIIDTNCFVFSDMSTASFIGQNDVLLQPLRKRHQYQAPEVHLRKEFSTKSNVYSLALLSVAFQRKTLVWPSDDFQEIRASADTTDVPYLREMLMDVQYRPSAGRILQVLVASHFFGFSPRINNTLVCQTVGHILQCNRAYFTNLKLDLASIDIHLSVLPVIFFNITYPLNHLHGTVRKHYSEQILVLFAYLEIIYNVIKNTETNILKYVLTNHVPNFSNFFIFSFEVTENIDFCKTLLLCSVQNKLVVVDDNLIMLAMDYCYEKTRKVDVLQFLLRYAPESNIKRLTKICLTEMQDNAALRTDNNRLHEDLANKEKQQKERLKRAIDALSSE